jgi:hypothetical protein
MRRLTPLKSLLQQDSLQASTLTHLTAPFTLSLLTLIRLTLKRVRRQMTHKRAHNTTHKTTHKTQNITQKIECTLLGATALRTGA